MAGRASDCPREDSGLQRNPEAAWRQLITFLRRAPRRQTFLCLAALVQLAALTVGSLTAATLPPLLLAAAGLFITLLALTSPAPDLSPALPTERASTATADASPPPGATPLPFMGDRLVLDTSALAAPGLASAASRASRMTVLKRSDWGQLMARVSHELRTPLNAVIGFSDVMTTEMFGPVGHPRYREYATHIRDCGRELLKSAEDTLAITCLLDQDDPLGSASVIDLASVARDAWGFFAESAAARDIKLDLQVPDDLELVGERKLLRQILINLLSEGVGRAGPGGVIALTASSDGDLAQIEILVPETGRIQSADEASLSVCLARALLELQGAPLMEINDPACAWRAVTVLNCAVQRDFFDLGSERDVLPVHVC